MITRSVDTPQTVVTPLVLDLRQEPAPVLVVDITNEGWNSAIPQAHDVGRFVEQVESGTFDITR